jgi:hypothetical protein
MYKLHNAVTIFSKAKAAWLMLMTVLLITACASNKPQINVDENQNFAQINTFYVQAPTTQINDTLKAHLEATISDALRAKGLTSESEENADVIVGYFPSTSSKEDGTSLSLGLGTGSYGRSGGISLGSIFNIPVGEQVSLHQTLQIDIVKNGQFIYSASGSIELEKKDSISVQQKLDELVTTLLAQYPNK